MDSRHHISLLLFFSSLAISVAIGNGQSTLFNLIDFGAVGDGKTDDSQAFLKAWQALCTATGGTPTLNVPGARNFLLKPVKFTGPCKSSTTHIQVLGKISAPSKIEDWGTTCAEGWISFFHVNNLIVDGNGVIDGQGSVWWNNKGNKCNQPVAVSFYNNTNLKLSGLNHLNSPKSHIKIYGCSTVSISNIHITAPQNSPNTDGIDITASSGVSVLNSQIGTGDDCIAINGGSSAINIFNVTCGPGHGISIGSLGDPGHFDTVENVNVTHCTFTKTENGARIKTWLSGKGFARKITFRDITLNGAQRPIVIDQNYCDETSGCGPARGPSQVAVSGVTYSGFQGSSAGLVAITLNCSAAVPCSGISLNQINITSPGQKTIAICSNAHGTCTKPLVPPVPCIPGC